MSLHAITEYMVSVPRDLDQWLYDFETGKTDQRRRGQYMAIQRIWLKYAASYHKKGVLKPTICRDRAFKL